MFADAAAGDQNQWNAFNSLAGCYFHKNSEIAALCVGSFLRFAFW
jgi:hypothetical protein